MADFSPYVGAAACGLMVVVYLCAKSDAPAQVLSRILDAYLRWKYPVYSVDGTRSLPTCAYQWPNGQGDVGKFFGGAENRDAWERAHGAVYRIWNGLAPEVVLTRPEHVQIVFRDSHQHIKATDNNSGWLFGALLGQCLGLISQERWRRLRATTEPPFTRSAAATYVPAIDDRVDAHVQHLLRRPKKEDPDLEGGGSVRTVHPVDDFRFLAFWSIADVLYGKLPPELETRLKAIVPLREALFHRAITGGWRRFAWTKHLPNSTRRGLQHFKTEWAAINQAAYEHARSTAALQRAPIVTLMDARNNAEDPANAVEQEELLQTLDEMLFANLDVTMGGLSWNLLFLAADPELQAELREESIAARASGDWYGYLLRSTTLLAACIAESARLKPLAAFSIPQAAPTARQVEDFVIPAGTNFIIDTHAVNIRNAYWGPDRDCYRPHRFLEKDAPQSARYYYWRFGFGPRTCLGRYVADLILRCVVVHLVHAHRLALHPGTDAGPAAWKRKPETWITQADTTIACTPLDDDHAAE